MVDVARAVEATADFCSDLFFVLLVSLSAPAASVAPGAAPKASNVLFWTMDRDVDDGDGGKDSGAGDEEEEGRGWCMHS